MQRKLGMRHLGLFCVVVLVTATAAAGQDGLLGYWPLDAGQGDVAVDASGNGNDGEIWDAQWVRGRFGTALWFDGQNAHVRIPEIAALDGAEAMTVEAWVYWEGTGRYPNILTGGTWSPGGFMICVQDDRCFFRMGRPGVSAATDKSQWREVGVPLVGRLELGRWYHLVATFQRPVIKTYVNGRQAGSAKWDFPIGHRGELVIGKWAGAVTHRGLIDEVKVFGRALTPEEIAAEYKRQAPARVAGAEGKPPYEKIPRRVQLASAAAVFENQFTTLAISPQGRVVALVDKQTGEDRLARSTPLVTLRIGNRLYRRAACSQEAGKLLFRFAKVPVTVVVAVEAKAGYYVFRVESVSEPNVDEVTFVTVAPAPSSRVCSMSGLAADEQFGVCLRTLNLETLVQVETRPVRLRATAFRRYGLNKGRAALVACPSTHMLHVLQDLVRAEGVPYSPVSGAFAQQAEENRGSYVFARVSEANVEQWIELAQRAGVATVHLSGWQKTLGHYQPNEKLFPHGLDGLKTVADKLHAAGLRVGIHTLTGCISPGDPFVRPVPDRRLATDGEFLLAADLDSQHDTVPTTEAPGNYPTVWAYGSRGNCIRIDDELILYSAISNEPPYGFSGCRRGAFGTRPAAHKKGSPVYHLYARYGCFVPDEHSTLVDEVAEQIARVYNTCGLDQIYMDGAEAMRGWYGIARMRRAIFTRLQRPALVEASCWDHHSWPFHSRVGAWDHPKWGLKRFADDHFLAAQQYRNAFLLEPQLGWWVILGPARDWDMEMPDELEYLLAKALGHDTPLSFQNLAVGTAPSNARQEEYLTMIGQYERLRLANYFTDAVKEKLRQPREEFRLVQADDGQWCFLPTDYQEHKVTDLHDGSNRWTVTNRFAAQPIKLRIAALYAAVPYDDEGNRTLADFAATDDFSPAGSAPGVRCTWDVVPNPVKAGKASGQLTASNKNDSPVGAWGRVVKQFDPVVDLTPYDALGFWIRGDGNGELLNVQLTNLREYFSTLDDHYVKIDFHGWRYVELLFRERDAAAYHDYRWPYGAHCVLHRSPLVRHAVNKITLYLNNLPPGKTATCLLSPIKALRTQKVVLRNPVIELGGRSLRFPVALESGMYLEFESAGDCRLYDERGRLLQWVQPEGQVPVLTSGPNEIAFRCEGPKGFRSRAAITVISTGPPLRGRRPKEQINWSLLRRQYRGPWTILAIDGKQNQWNLLAEAEGRDPQNPQLGMELQVEETGPRMAAYEAPSAVTLESFELPRQPDRTNVYDRSSYAYDSQSTAKGCSPGVVQQLAPSADVVKIGSGAARYTATSTRSDNGGWSVKGKRFPEPLDLSGFAAIGFWLCGDGGGQQFKLQLRDAAGGWHDMYTKVDFVGWRYCQFDLQCPNLKDPTKITAMNVYYNGIPANKTVTCYIDEIRLLRNPQPLREPTLVVAGRPVRFPVALNAGDRLVFRTMGDCKLLRTSGRVETVTPDGTAPRLQPGSNRVSFTLKDPPEQFRINISFTTEYSP